MVKKSEINKKGRLAKSTLSVVLAASMVLTSSSFVWAAPVEDIAIVEEGDTAVEAVEVPVEGAVDTEEVVGATINSKFTFPSTVFTFTNNDFTVGDATIATSVLGQSILRQQDGVDDSRAVSSYVSSPLYTVTVKNIETGAVTTISAGADIPTTIGNYILRVEGNDIVDGRGFVATGYTEASYSVKDDYSKKATAVIDPVTYTGSAIEPKIRELTVDGVATPLKENTDYKIVDYSKNINASNDAGVEVEFIGSYSSRANEIFKFTINKAGLTASNTRITVANPSVVYNGTEQKPAVQVEFKAEGSTTYQTLAEGTDYVLTMDPASVKNVGKYNVDVTGLNNFENVVSKTGAFEITAKEFNKNTITVENLVIPFTGTKKYNANDIVVKDTASGAILAKGTDFEVLYYDNGVYVYDSVATGKGDHAIRIKAKATNYKAGYIDTIYTVEDVEANLENFVKANKPVFDSPQNTNEYPYNAEGVVPAKVTIGTIELTSSDNKVTGTGAEADRFSVVFPNKNDCKAVGTYDIKLTGKGLWAGQSTTLQYKVVQKDMSSVNPEAATVHKSAIGSQAYNVIIKDVTTTLSEGVDYDVVMRSDEGNNGKYKLIITYKGNYTGTKTIGNLGISTTYPLTSSNIKAEVTGEYIYAGKQIKPAASSIVLTEVSGSTSTPLRLNVDYTIKSYGTNNAVGKGTVVVEAVTGSLYTDTRTIEFDIKAGNTVKDNYILETTNLKSVYELGSAFNPAKDIKVKTTAGKYLASSEYDVKYLRNGNETTDFSSAGTVTMEVTVKATKVTLTATYKVATSLDKIATIPSTFSDEAYTGKTIEPTVTVTKKNTTIALVKDKDYTVSYDNNVNPGTGYITIEGTGDYYGTYIRTFKIVGQLEQKIEVLPAQERDLKTRTLQSKATKVKYTTEPKTEVSYKSSDEKVVTVDAKTGAIEYKGVGTATIIISAAESEIYKAATKELTVKVLPATPANVKVTSTAKKKITVKAGEVKEAAKYQIKIWKTGKKATFVNVDNKGALSKVYTTKSAGKFNVQVRAYKTIDNVHHFSAWSAVKTVTVK